MPSTRSGPRPTCHCHCRNCGAAMRPDFGNICPNCKPVVLEEGEPFPPFGCLLLALAIGAALSVWVLNL